MPEYPKFTVTLHGQEVTGTYGHTMRLVKAKTEAGPQPPDAVDADKPTEAESMAFILWSAEFVRVYFDLLPDFIKDCTAEEIMLTANAIGDAALRDPFGQLPEKPRTETEPAKPMGVGPTFQPTTGS